MSDPNKTPAPTKTFTREEILALANEAAALAANLTALVCDMAPDGTSQLAQSRSMIKKLAHDVQDD